MKRLRKRLASRYFYLVMLLALSSHSFKQVFAGNLSYTTTDEGLKAFFAPVANDMYVALF